MSSNKPVRIPLAAAIAIACNVTAPASESLDKPLHNGTTDDEAIHAKAEDKPLSFVEAAIQFFGLRNVEGQNPRLAFGRELKACTHADRLEFYDHFRSIGINCLPPVEKAVGPQAAAA